MINLNDNNMKPSRKLLIAIILTLVANLTFSQDRFNNDSINKYNKDKKKNGIWIEYLDRNWVEVKSEEKSKSSFYRYVFYDNGFRVTSVFKPEKHQLKKATLSDKSNHPLILNGKYLFYYKNGAPYCYVEYNDGLESGRQIYYTRKGKISAEYFYDIKWNNTPYTFYVKLYKKNGDLKTSGFYAKYDEKMWGIFPE